MEFSDSAVNWILDSYAAVTELLDQSVYPLAINDHAKRQLHQIRSVMEQALADMPPSG